jgi:K+ transporter
MLPRTWQFHFEIEKYNFIILYVFWNEDNILYQTTNENDLNLVEEIEKLKKKNQDVIVRQLKLHGRFQVVKN